MQPLIKFLRLSHRDRFLLASALILLLATRMWMRVLPFHLCRPILFKMQQEPAEAQEADGILVHRVVWAVSVSERCLRSASSCLVRAVVTKALLSWYAHPACLRIGVTKNEEGQLQAHAWVESQGRVVIGDLTDLSRFIFLPPLQ